jgi:glycosyltransferase involved in cell wall biosynthesis
MPTNDIENDQYRSDQLNQFGNGKLTYALADFQPDIVFCIRDYWMDEHVLRNPLRDRFHVMWMPTVDGYPQRWEWLHDYGKVDTLCTYSHFGKKALESQSRSRLASIRKISKLDVTNVCQPGVDLNIYKPLLRNEIRATMGVPDGMRFCGSVMRNQPRKLFPRIIEAFGIFKRKYSDIAHDVYLLLHTSIPDVGWDRGLGIVETIDRCNLEKYVLFTYICRACRYMSIQPSDPVREIIKSSTGTTRCPRCNKNEFATPMTKVGYPSEYLNRIYNLLDVYIQGSIAEGDGMPVNEAKAAGVPTIMSNYSALYEKARNGGALPVENKAFFLEGGGCPDCDNLQRGSTMQKRSLFDKKHMAKRLAELFGDENYRMKMSREAHECAKKYYDWDLVSLKWQAMIDNLDLKDRKNTCDSQKEIRVATKESPPEGLDDEQWLLWCYQNILQRRNEDDTPVDKVDPDGRRTWLGQLNAGIPRSMIEGRLRQLMKHNEELKKVLEDPDKFGLNPVEQIKREIERIEAEDKKNQDAVPCGQQ